MGITASKKIEKLIESFGIHLSLVGGCFVVSFFSHTLCQRIAVSAPMSPSCEWKCEQQQMH